MYFPAAGDPRRAARPGPQLERGGARAARPPAGKARMGVRGGGPPAAPPAGGMEGQDAPPAVAVEAGSVGLGKAMGRALALFDPPLPSMSDGMFSRMATCQQM